MLKLDASRIKIPTTPMQITPQQQIFADAVIQGMPQIEAYRKAGYKFKNAATGWAASSRLAARPDVSAYIAAARMTAAKSAVLTLQEKREFLARIVRTPLRAIDPNDPDHKDGDLIKKYKYSSTHGEEGDRETEEFEKLDPLKALELDNKLSGDDPDTNAINGLAAAIANLPRVSTTEDKL